MDSRRVVVLDPGHGGYDRGARGAGGSLEKNVTLRLAFAIANALKPYYRVVITRTGDYRIELTRRTSIANHQGADIFISIHTGASLLHHINAWEVYYFKKPSFMTGGGVNSPSGLDDKSGYRQKWEDTQIRYTKKNKQLAECLKSRLLYNHMISGVDVSGAPLRILEGADMPAILLEAGYLTNPKTEKLLNDPGFLSRVGDDIRKGIDDFFNTEN